jgi:hypothetical protein
MSGFSLARGEAVELLARRMYAKFAHIEPTKESWDDLADAEHDMYRHVADYLFCAPREWLNAAMSWPLPSDHVMHCHPLKITEQMDSHHDKLRVFSKMAWRQDRNLMEGDYA